MVELIKITALCAALSCSVVTAYNQPFNKLEAAVSGKHQDRVTSSTETRLTVAAYSGGTVGHASRAGKDEQPITRSEAPGRFVTVESRQGATTSVLTRVPQIALAER